MPLGRTFGFPANGAVSNLAIDAVPRSRACAPRSRRRLRRGPPPRAGRADHRLGRAHGGRRAARRHVPLLLGPTGSRTTRATSLGARAAAEPPARADRRVRGGRLDRAALLRRPLPRHPQRRRTCPSAPPTRAARRRRPLRIVFVGQAVERKGLPVLLRAFEALREHVPAELTLVGATPDEVEPLLLDDARRRARSARSTTSASARRCATPTCSCAPSLGGESFGMVLTEAFAAGHAGRRLGHRRLPRRRARRRRRRARPARRRDRAGRDAARPRARRPSAARAWRRRRAEHAERYAWPRVAERGRSRPTRTRSRSPRAAAAPRRPPCATALRPADLGRASPAAAPAEPRAAAARGRRRARALAIARRAALGAVALGGLCLAFVALERIGVDNIVRSLVASKPGVGARRPRRDVRVDGRCAASRWHAILERRAARACASGSATRCRARSSACSCRRRCRRASASRRAR